MARFEYELAPRTPTVLTLAIRCDRERRPAPIKALERAESEASASLDHARAGYAVVESSSERFNHWLRRSAADLRMLVSTTPYGEYPYAGVPWFSTPFGRDGIITAFQTLWINPRIARGVLDYLAATQADHVDPQQDAEPGKILHETRSSEMARLGEVPFGRYYGSVDATPLFVMLAGAYFDRTGDREFLIRLWPHVERALAWIDECGDRDGDGFVEYARHSPTGLVHQGWKDSQDSVFHADGSLAEAPIALCEVQAYVYDARRRAAALADALGDGARATALRDRRSGCGGRSRIASGATISEPTRSRSTDTRNPARCGARTPATACSAASRRRSARGASPSSSSGRRCFRAGASAPSRRRSRDTTRCRITTVRCGPTTTASSRPVSRDTGSTI